jgi:hypothetical protein
VPTAINDGGKALGTTIQLDGAAEAFLSPGQRYAGAAVDHQHAGYRSGSIADRYLCAPMKSSSPDQTAGCLHVRVSSRDLGTTAQRIHATANHSCSDIARRFSHLVRARC